MPSYLFLFPIFHLPSLLRPKNGSSPPSQASTREPPRGRSQRNGLRCIRKTRVDFRVLSGDLRAATTGTEIIMHCSTMLDTSTLFLGGSGEVKHTRSPNEYKRQIHEKMSKALDGFAELDKLDIRI